MVASEFLLLCSRANTFLPEQGTVDFAAVVPGVHLCVQSVSQRQIKLVFVKPP